VNLTLRSETESAVVGDAERALAAAIDALH
jgi:hypothetical protein